MQTICGPGLTLLAGRCVNLATDPGVGVDLDTRPLFAVIGGLVVIVVIGLLIGRRR